MLPGTILIDRLRLSARHGVLEQEREVGNLFEISLRLTYDMERAAESDSVDAAVDYAAVIEAVKQEMACPSNLLEAVAQRLRRRICRDFPQIISGKVRVAKLTPPIPCRVESVGVEIEWNNQ